MSRACTKCGDPARENDSWCEGCFKIYNKEYMRVRRSDPHFKEAERRRASVRRQLDGEASRKIGRRHFQGQQEWLNSIKNEPCLDCGNNFPPCCMDFDHVRGTKSKTITQLLGYRKERILEEIAKCDLVCACCHRVRTANRKGPVLYSPQAYEFYRRMGELKSRPCADCSRCFSPVAMDFDHVRGEKTRGLALMTYVPWSLVEEELSKCDLVCACCHRIRTQSRRVVVAA